MAVGHLKKAKRGEKGEKGDRYRVSAGKGGGCDPNPIR